ncbi:hypothetical protein CNMCM5793_000212 [Aspergillus hiratsukae]|uniref:Uncharacterized protein n=1 Tax=Aspergillus hiratsukae TaxID=1194566 RepID=A0A8H6UFW7_9EURO|nr:hypothetical protein CNMCM5793_000212 [Aspergillus hiratsukae]KAF7164054.1 hypothetical protein CNMCM6106_000748 [Aspergillus hiratsukae]
MQNVDVAVEEPRTITGRDSSNIGSIQLSQDQFLAEPHQLPSVHYINGIMMVCGMTGVQHETPNIGNWVDVVGRRRPPAIIAQACQQHCWKNTLAMTASEFTNVYGYNNAPPMTQMIIRDKRRLEIYLIHPQSIPPVSTIVTIHLIWDGDLTGLTGQLSPQLAKLVKLHTWPKPAKPGPLGSLGFVFGVPATPS